MFSLLLAKKCFKLARFGQFCLPYLGIAVPTPKKWKDQPAGQGLVEYAMIMVLVAIVVIIVLALLGPYINRIFNTVNCALHLPEDMEDCFETETPEPPDPPESE